MKIRVRWLVPSIIAVVIFTGCLAFNFFAQNSSKILADSNMVTGMQNFSVAYDSTKKITLVGAYTNVLTAFNEQGEKLWDFATKGPVREIKIDEKTRKAYIGCEDRNVYILDMEDGTQKGIINVQRRIYSIDISEDASMIAVSAGVSPIKHGLYVYDGSGKELWRKDIGSVSKKVAFNSDYSKIFLVTDRAEIMTFDLKGNQTAVNKLGYAITDMDVNRSQKLIAVLTGNCTYYLFDDNLQQIASAVFDGTGRSVALSENGQWIAAGTEEGRFYIAGKTGNKVFETNINNTVTGILFEEDAAYVTGTGNFIYTINAGALETIHSMNSFKSVTGILLYIMPFIAVILLILAFDPLRKRISTAFRVMKKHRFAYLMLMPTFVLLIVFAYIPVVRAFIMSFTDWSISNNNALTIKFIGFENFRLMMEEGYFLLGLKNLLILAGTTFLKLLTIPLFVAELVFLMKGDRKKYWFRFLFVLPMVVPTVISALIWQNIYDPNMGLLNNILDVLNLDTLKKVWLGDPATAIWAIVFMGFPFIDAFAFLVYYGGLINISPELFEAAKVDGSNGWWNFTKIHLPLITPQIKMLIILSFIGTVQNFTPILILTNGGPGVATYVPGLELYYNATSYGRYGYACALGVVMFIAIFAGTLLNMRIKTASENEF